MKTIRTIFTVVALFLITPSFSFAGTQTFTSNGTFIVPVGVTSVLVNMSGGGGGGGMQWSWVCGVSQFGTSGGTTSFGGLLVALGGFVGNGGSDPALGGAAGGAGGVSGSPGGWSWGGAGGGSLFGSGGTGFYRIPNTQDFPGTGGNGYGAGGGGGITGGGGGGGAAFSGRVLTVVSGQIIPVTVGTGGLANIAVCPQFSSGAGATGFVSVSWTDPTFGTINVSSNISSSWTITGPATITGSGTSQSSPSKPTGTYTITWNDVAGYTKPTSQSLTLVSGGTITFNGVYTTSINLVSQNLSVPASATSGTALNFTADVRNIGTAGTDIGFSDNFSYQWNGTGGTWTNLPLIPKTPLLASAMSGDFGSYTPTQTGTLYIQHCVDSANVVNEGTDETPNCSVSGAGIIVTPPPNTPPIATITIPAINITIPENQDQQFTGEATDTDGTIVGYEWRVGNCATGTILSSLVSFVKSFTLGTYDVYFRAQDNNGFWSSNCPSRRIDVIVNNQIPGVCGSANGVPTQIKPVSNLCATVGLPSPVVLPNSNFTPSWSWVCAGENGGADATCGAVTSCGDNKCQASKGENPSTCRIDCKINVIEF